MLIENALYSAIDLYIRKINQYLEEGHVISPNFKTYDKSKDNDVVFKCFDIKSQVKTNGSFILSEITYSGHLEFTYNKATNELYVSKLPYYDDGKAKIPIFTSDIAQIIVDKLKIYIPKEEIKLTFFSPLVVFTIDNKVNEIIPSINSTKNFNTINYIVTKIADEERRIKQHVLDMKAKRDREDRTIERAISKKRRIYDIDPNDYENQEEFYSAVNKRICEIYDKKIANIKRHIEANERKYKQLLREADFDLSFMVYERDIDQKFSGCSDDDECELLINEYLDRIYTRDLNPENGFLAAINYVRKEFLQNDEKGKGRPRKPRNILYLQAAQFFKRSDQFYWHPIIESVRDSFQYERENYSREFQQCIDLLLHINALKNKLKECLEVRNNPDKAILTFTRLKDAWCSIMQFPYWIRLGKDRHQGASTTYNLLMIKPGTRVFDKKNLKSFIDKLNKSHSDKLKIQCDRMTIAIPDSLEHDSLLKVIEFAHFNAISLNFICESPDLATRIKAIFVSRELQAIKDSGHTFNPKNQYYISNKFTFVDNQIYYLNCFINVDPNYYNAFLVDSPDNKTFWHRYDYSSDYKYRRKIIYDLKTIINLCVQEYLRDKQVPLDEKVLNEMILGSYTSGDDNCFDLESYLLSNQGIDGRDLSDTDDRILALMQERPFDWKKSMTLIEQYKWDINTRMGLYSEEFQQQKEEMMLFKSLFQNGWQDRWTRIHRDESLYEGLIESYRQNPEATRGKILRLKKEFPHDWHKRIGSVIHYKPVEDKLDENEILPF